MEASKVATTPFAGQKPGTSGLRKKVTEFTQPNYMENFIQCTLSAVGNTLEGSTLVVGGDGRFGVPEAVDLIIKMAAANKVFVYFHIPIQNILITRKSLTFLFYEKNDEFRTIQRRCQS